MKKSSAYLLLGGGAAALSALWFRHKSVETTDAIKQAVSGNAPPPAPGQPVSLPTVNLRLTGYWPLTARPDEREMEGGMYGAAGWGTDRHRVVDPATGKRVRLSTLEQHRADPINHPYVSLSGDLDIWPFGQRIVIPEFGSNLVFRVVDTGSHFHGIKKIFRVEGYEPIDVCVNSSETLVPKKVTAQIVPGDNFERGKAVASGGFRGQTIAAGEGYADTLYAATAAPITEARTSADREALARAIESELGSHTKEEQVAAAWSMRNRADEAGTTVSKLLAPRGEYGSPSKSGGYASTRRAATEQSKAVANEVLDAPSTEDPTEGAVEFWVPSQQGKMRYLGDVHRDAVKRGDADTAKKYEKYANYGTEDDVRLQHARDGLAYLRAVGIIEVLGRLG